MHVVLDVGSKASNLAIGIKKTRASRSFPPQSMQYVCQSVLAEFRPMNLCPHTRRYQENNELRQRLAHEEHQNVKQHSENHQLEDRLDSLESEQEQLQRQEAEDR
jgi:hypothetical protein